MVAGSPSVAIRVYTANDIANLEGSDISNAGSEIALSLSEEVDGLLNFRDSFEHSILFFVLNNGQLQRDQLGRRESFVSRAQRSLLSRNKDGNDENGKKVEF